MYLNNVGRRDLHGWGGRYWLSWALNSEFNFPSLEGESSSLEFMKTQPFSKFCYGSCVWGAACPF